MGTLEDVKNMQREGRSEQEIVAALQQRGIPQDEIYNSLAQAKITEAVSDPGASPEQQPMPQGAEQTAPIQEQQMPPQGPVTQEAGMPQQPMPQDQGQPQQDIYAQAPTTAGAMEASYQQPQPQQTLSSDTITEIAEQIISERFAPIKDQLESALDLKNTMESKMDYIDERLKKIEKIIDRLQLSILQKVGDYVTNVEDIKREMVETQKSFKSLLEKSGKPIPKPLPKATKKVSEE